MPVLCPADVAGAASRRRPLATSSGRWGVRAVAVVSPPLQPERRRHTREPAAGPGVAAGELGGSLVVTTRRKSVLASVRAELDQIGKSASPMGAVALTLAARLDAGEDPGSAMAAMAKELRLTMTELNQAAPVAKDPVDELKRKRERRLSG